MSSSLFEKLLRPYKRLRRLIHVYYEVVTLHKVSAACSGGCSRCPDEALPVCKHYSTSIYNCCGDDKASGRCLLERGTMSLISVHEGSRIIRIEKHELRIRIKMRHSLRHSELRHSDQDEFAASAPVVFSFVVQVSFYFVASSSHVLFVACCNNTLKKTCTFQLSLKQSFEFPGACSAMTFGLRAEKPPLLIGTVFRCYSKSVTGPL